MISFLKGKIIDVGEKYAVLDVNGIGYKVFVPETSLHGMKKGANIEYWTHMAVRENSMDLFGFVSKKDLEFFELLITISGIGPKSALNILSLVDADVLKSSIRSGSTAHLVKVSGIGRKTAEKIVLELKDKISYSAEDVGVVSSDIDVVDALKALGYDAEEARQALKKVNKDIKDTGARVKAALKNLN